MNERYDRKATFKFRMISRIMRAAGLVSVILVFAVVFFAAAAGIWLVEPGIGNYGDALWFLYQVVATIGLGDFTCVTLLGRILAVIVSILSIFLLAVITGAVVSYCSEVVKAHSNQSAVKYLIKLENLDKLSLDELKEMSEQARRFGKSHGIEVPEKAAGDSQ